MSNHHWIVFPPQRNPPLVVSDLFEDVKDGVMLLALLEVLSGHKLVRKMHFWLFWYFIFLCYSKILNSCTNDFYGIKHHCPSQI